MRFNLTNLLLATSLLWILSINKTFAHLHFTPQEDEVSLQVAEGDSLFYIDQYKQAIVLFEEAETIYQSRKDWNNLQLVQLKIARCYFKDDYLEIAEKYINKITSGKKGFKEHDLHLAKANQLQGNIIELRDFDYEKARVYFKRCLDYFQKKEDAHPMEKSLAYGDVGVSYLFTGNLDEAEKHIKLGYQVLLQADSKEGIDFTMAYHFLGLVKVYKNEYDSSIYYWNKMLSDSTLNKSELSLISGIHSNLSYAYSIIGNNEMALEHKHKELKILLEIFQPHHLRIAQAYNSISISYRVSGEYENALTYSSKAIEISKKAGKKIPVDFLEQLASIYNDLNEFEKANEILTEAVRNGIPKKLDKMDVYMQLGSVNTQLEFYEKALVYYDSAEAMLNKIKTPEHITLPYIYLGLAQVYEGKKDFSKGVSLTKKAISLLQDDFNKQPEIADAYRLLSTYYDKLGEEENALKAVQKSIIANVLDFNDSSYLVNPELENYLNELSLMESLEVKAELLNKPGDLESKLLAAETYALCDQLIQKVRKWQSNKADKKYLLGQNRAIYQNAINLCVDIFDQTGQVEYLHQSFQYVEKNKGALLAEALTTLSLQKQPLLADSLEIVEYNIHTKTTFYEKELMNLELKGADVDSATLADVNNKLFVLKEQKGELVNYLKRNYANYYELKYQDETPTIGELQNNTLTKDEALINYFLGDHDLFIYVITQNDFEVKKISIDSSFHQHFYLFKESLSQANITDQSSRKFNEYTSTAHYFYQQLIAPIAENIKRKDLIIVPDDQLALLPFEALLTSKPEASSGEDYGTLPYLVLTHNIRYVNSSTLLVSDFWKKDRTRSQIQALAFAPSFNIDNESKPLTIDSVRSSLKPLGWNEKEIEKLMIHFEGSSYFGEDATEKIFKNQAKTYDIIHIASHSLVDDKNPMYSKIAFAEDRKDTLNDGYLHTFELFGAQLKAEMVVLSACNTGSGKIQKGEGVMSLGYAFTYAGAPSVVMSHWQVNDKSTYLLMDKFYGYLADGMTKSKALQKAKRALINNPNTEYAHPYFWAAFVAYGKDTPIFKPSARWPYYVGGAFIVLLAIGLFLRRKSI